MRTVTAAIILICWSCLSVATAQTPLDEVMLITLSGSFDSFLIDMDGNVVRTYHGSSAATRSAYLLPDQSVLRPARDPNGQFTNGGGRIQIISADDEIVWDFYYSNEEHQQHHDVEYLPNGNVLMIAFQWVSRADAIAHGRVNLDIDYFFPTMIVEVQPDGFDGGIIVWQWRLWDHLIQDTDPTKPNYGVLADHPELVDINACPVNTGSFDHANSVDYNLERDEIVFSCHKLSEVLVIDHSTTTEEAAGHTGGNRGRGGDILYRWGNPQNYDRPGEQRFSGFTGRTGRPRPAGRRPHPRVQQRKPRRLHE